MTDAASADRAEVHTTAVHTTRSRTATMQTLLQTQRRPGWREKAGDALRVISPLGWTVMVLTIGAWITVAAFGWEEVRVIAASLLVLLVVCVLFVLGRLDLGSEIGVSAARVVVGDRDVTGQLLLINRRSRDAFGLRLELPIGDQIATFPVARLPGEASVSHQFDIPTDRRTVLPVGPVTTVQGDPLGLFRRVRTWSEVEEIFVHPRTVALPTTAMGLLRDMEGSPTTDLSPSDVAFHALREYAPGDERRHIHWRSSAKLGTLMVRQFVDTRRTHVGLALSADLDEYEDDDEFEVAISAAASLAVQALMDGQTVSIAAGNVLLPAVDALTVLDHFSAIEAQGPSGSMMASLLQLREHATESSVVVTCVGRSVTVPEIRRAVSSIESRAATLVVRAATELEPGYQVVESTTVLQIPDIERLGAGLMAVDR